MFVLKTPQKELHFQSDAGFNAVVKIVEDSEGRVVRLPSIGFGGFEPSVFEFLTQWLESGEDQNIEIEDTSKKKQYILYEVLPQEVTSEQVILEVGVLLID